MVKSHVDVLIVKQRWEFIVSGKWVILFVMLAGWVPIAVYGGNGPSKKANEEKEERKKPTKRINYYREPSLLAKIFTVISEHFAEPDPESFK